MKIKSAKNHGKPCWVVDFGLVNGVRKRIFCATREEAEQAARARIKDQKAVGDQWANLPVQQRTTIMEIVNQIEEAGHTLPGVWEFFQNHRPATRVQTPLHEAIAKCLAVKAASNLRPSYLSSMKQILDLFAAGQEKRSVDEFSLGEIEDWIASREGGAWWRLTLRTRLSVFFSFCKKRKWIEENPCDGLERERIDHGVPSVLTPVQCARLLEAARQISREALPWFVLSMFAGIRSFEIGRLAWKDIDLIRKQVILGSSATKGRRPLDRRIVPLSDNAVAWLKLGGEVPYHTVNHRSRIDAIQESAGITPWPQNVLRHTAASYLLAREQDAAKVTLWLGNSDRMLFAHYRDLVTPEASAEFWKIFPRGVDNPAAA